MSTTHYELLNLQKNCSLVEVKKAYRKISAEWRVKHAAEKGQDNSGIDAINKAFEVLSDASLRKAYDEELARKEPERARGAQEGAAMRSVSMRSVSMGSDQASGSKDSKMMMIGVGAACVLSVGGWFAFKKPADQPAQPVKAEQVGAPVKAMKFPPKSNEAAPAEPAAQVVQPPAAAAPDHPAGQDSQSSAVVDASKVKSLADKAAADEKKKADVEKEDKKKKLEAEKKAEDEKKRKADPEKDALAKKTVEQKNNEESRKEQAAAPVPAPLPVVPAQAAAPTPTPAVAAMGMQSVSPGHCPTQVTPEMPKRGAFRDPLAAGLVKVKVVVKDGAVVSVDILSGPKPYHAGVRAAVMGYKCKKEPAEAFFFQEFNFKLED